MVDKLYEDYTHQALIMAQGDVQKADYLLDCTWYEYLYRKKSYQKYNEWYAAELKNAKKG